MKTFFRTLFVGVVGSVALVSAAQPAVADPSFGSDAGVPVIGTAGNTILEPAPGAPVLGPVLPPPATVLPSLLTPPNPLGFGDVLDFSYGDENPMFFPLSVEFSVAAGVGPLVPEPPGPLCLNALDDDGDGFINDGCAPILGPEPLPLCANAIDDDFDGVINDGCPPRGAPAPATGHPLAIVPPPPAFDLRIEAGVLPPPPAGDLFVDSDIYAIAPGPVPALPGCVVYGNRQILDGDGFPGAPFGLPRLAINMPEPGSNVDGYDRLDFTRLDTVAGPPAIDIPVFFTIDAATAAGWAAAIPAPTAGPPVLAMPTPADILAWNPAIGGPVIWATGAALGLPAGSVIDALSVTYMSGFPLPSFLPGPSGWNFGPAGDFIVFSLAPGSPPLAPTSNGLGMFPSACFGPGTATGGDLFLHGVPFGPVLPWLDAEQLGLSAVRSGGPVDDNVDAMDICNVPPAFTDIDSDGLADQCDFDTDGDGVSNELDPDDDGDGFADTPAVLHEGPSNTDPTVDNCIGVPNPGQENNDGSFVDTTPPLTQNDTSRPMSDAAGDACDPDDDNDGLADTVELSLLPCATATGPLDPFHPDSDGDGYMDSAECSIGTNPNSSASKPSADQCRILAGAPAIPTDTDGDLIQDRIEVCGYGSSVSVIESDGDGGRDQCEVASLNTLSPVNSLDQLLLAQAIIADLGGPFVWNADLNKDGANNSADQLLMAQIILSLPGC